MPAKPSKGHRQPSRGSGQRAPGKKDVFARMDGVVVDRLDEMVKATRPRITRSALVANLIEKFVETEYPKCKARKQAGGT